MEAMLKEAAAKDKAHFPPASSRGQTSFPQIIMI
jgi:hypothetical protein